MINIDIGLDLVDSTSHVFKYKLRFRAQFLSFKVKVVLANTRSEIVRRSRLASDHVSLVFPSSPSTAYWYVTRISIFVKVLGQLGLDGHDVRQG